MKKRIFSLMLTTCVCGTLFAQSLQGSVKDHLTDNMNNNVYRYFGPATLGSIALAAVHPSAWIGNSVINSEMEKNPFHFSAGIAVSGAVNLPELLDAIKNETSFSSFGGYAAPIIRMGGFMLPFDFAISGIFLPLSLDKYDTWIFNAVFDFRYQVIREDFGIDYFDSADNFWSSSTGVFIPSFSVGAGFGFSMIEVNNFLTNQRFSDAGGTITGDAEIMLRLESYAFYFNFQFSKNITLGSYHRERELAVFNLEEPLFYWIPYLGVKLAVGTSLMRGGETALNLRNPQGAPVASYDFSQKYDDGFRLHPIIYGGLGTKMLQCILLNIGVSYDFNNSLAGVNISLGVTF